MPRAPPVTLFAVSACILFLFYVFWSGSGEKPLAHLAHVADRIPPAASTDTSINDVASGPAIMPKLGNETAKAELGRAAWKLFHTTMSRFPDQPSDEESKALKDYIHLFARLYPCGECAAHFQQILKKYPPQTSSRSTAAAWACFVHNEVNVSKGKPVFDCANIGDWYDCGCAEDAEDRKTTKSGKGEAAVKSTESIEIVKDPVMNGG